MWQRRNAAETSVTGIRGRLEKDFDDKYLITVFQCLVHGDELRFISHWGILFKIIISNNKSEKKKKSCQWCTDSERRAEAPHHLIVHIIWQSTVMWGFFLFFFLFPHFYASLVTTSQLKMKYGTNYPIMSEKGRSLTEAWLKSNLTLISPNPLAGSNRELKSYFRDIALTPNTHTQTHISHPEMSVFYQNRSRHIHP